MKFNFDKSQYESSISALEFAQINKVDNNENNNLNNETSMQTKNPN